MSLQTPRLVDGVCVCEVCCHVIWESTFDCDSMVWSDPVNVSPGGGEVIGGPCPDDVDWYQPGDDNCVRHYDAYYPIANLCDDCDSVTKTPPEKPVGEPPDCCGNCCKSVWLSIYDCTTCSWSAPIIIQEFENVPCDSDSGWVDDGLSDCRSTYTQYTTPADCGDVPAPPDHPPGAPAGCATEGRWIFTATWNCDTQMWSVGAPSKTCCFSDCSETDWTPSSDCTATRTMCTDCEDCRDDIAPDPGVPSYDPSDTCCTTCCQTVWESIWDCGEMAWGTPFLYRPRIAFTGPCPEDQDWAYNACVDTCAAFAIVYLPASSPSACTSLPDPPPPSPPPGPFLAEPPLCCTNCDVYEGFTTFTCGDEPGTGTWDEVVFGDPVLVDVPCSCDDFSQSCCTRVYDVYVPTGGPPPPNFTPTGDPEDGCCDCVDCGGDQPDALISGWPDCDPDCFDSCVTQCEIDNDCEGDPDCIAACEASCSDFCACCGHNGPAVFSGGDCSWTGTSGDGLLTFTIELVGFCDGDFGRNTWRLTAAWFSGCFYDSGPIEDLVFCTYGGGPDPGILVGGPFTIPFDVEPGCTCPMEWTITLNP